MTKLKGSSSFHYGIQKSIMRVNWLESSINISAMLENMLKTRQDHCYSWF